MQRYAFILVVLFIPLRIHAAELITVPSKYKNGWTVYDITEDHDGNIWIGTLKGVSRFDGQNWTTFEAPEGPKVKKVYRIAAMQDSSIWFSHGNHGGGLGGITIYKNDQWKHLTQHDGLPVPYMRFIHQAPNKDIWLGTHHHDNVTGLIRFRNNTWQRIQSYDTLPRNNVFGIISDHQGQLWTLPSGRIVARYTPSDHITKPIKENP